MKAFVFTNRDLMTIMSRYCESHEISHLLKDMAFSSDLHLTDYFYNCLSCYLISYIHINDLELSFDHHNRIFETFSELAKKMQLCDYDVRQVDIVESIIGSGGVEQFGKYYSTIYDDVYKMLTDYYVTLYGTRQERRIDDSAREGLDKVVSLTTFVIEEIEGLMHNQLTDNRMRYVLFGTHQGLLYIFVL